MPSLSGYPGWRLRPDCLWISARARGTRGTCVCTARGRTRRPLAARAHGRGRTTASWMSAKRPRAPRVSKLPIFACSVNAIHFFRLHVQDHQCTRQYGVLSSPNSSNNQCPDTLLLNSIVAWGQWLASHDLFFSHPAPPLLTTSTMVQSTVHSTYSVHSELAIARCCGDLISKTTGKRGK